MDVAKLLAVLVPGTQALPDIYGVKQVRGGRLPLVQVPTTAGTGSEVTAVSIVTTADHRSAARSHRGDRHRRHGPCDRGQHQRT